MSVLFFILYQAYFLINWLGLALSLWYELSKHTKSTLLGSLGMAGIALAFLGRIVSGYVPGMYDVLMSGSIVLFLADRLIRKAICEPRGWRWWREGRLFQKTGGKNAGKT